MEFKQIIKEVRKELRAKFKGYKLSVTEQQCGTNHCMNISIYNQDGTSVSKEIKKQVKEIAQKRNNANDTDIMTDYFNYDYYAFVHSY